MAPAAALCASAASGEKNINIGLLELAHATLHIVTGFHEWASSIGAIVPTTTTVRAAPTNAPTPAPIARIVLVGYLVSSLWTSLCIITFDSGISLTCTAFRGRSGSTPSFSSTSQTPPLLCHSGFKPRSIPAFPRRISESLQVGYFSWQTFKISGFFSFMRSSHRVSKSFAFSTFRM